MVFKISFIYCRVQQTFPLRRVKRHAFHNFNILSSAKLGKYKYIIHWFNYGSNNRSYADRTHAFHLNVNHIT